VVLIGYDLWQRKFHRDPYIIGKTIRISRFDPPPTVIGVMPPGVRSLPSPGAAREPKDDLNGLVDFWMPITPNPTRNKAMQWDVAVRLREGTTPASWWKRACHSVALQSTCVCIGCLSLRFSKSTACRSI